MIAVEFLGGPYDGHETTIPALVFILVVPSRPNVQVLIDQCLDMKYFTVHEYHFKYRSRGVHYFQYHGER